MTNTTQYTQAPHTNTTSCGTTVPFDNAGAFANLNRPEDVKAWLTGRTNDRRR